MNIEILNTVQKMIKDTSVAEFQLQKADVTITIKSGGQVASVSEPVEITESIPSSVEKCVATIKSVDVGIFNVGRYGIKEGSTVKKGQVVGEVVSMGISHVVKSEVEGVISKQVVKNKEPVEYGEVIFEVEGA